MFRCALDSDRLLRSLLPRNLGYLRSSPREKSHDDLSVLDGRCRRASGVSPAAEEGDAGEDLEQAQRSAHGADHPAVCGEGGEKN